jgi:hypothetical protein
MGRVSRPFSIVPRLGAMDKPRMWLTLFPMCFSGAGISF